MLKSTFRFVLLFTATALISFVAASSAYFITQNIINKGRAVSNTGPTEALLPQAEAAQQNDIPVAAETYIVRLEDDSLCVYSLSDRAEEFLYSTDIYRPNLSDEDLSLLTSGVTLDNISELTGFMENYTS